MSKAIYARLDDADAAQLSKLAKKEQRSISWLVSQAVKMLLKSKSR